ncbi:hypothetical protein Z517_11812 [Fonsecaea pedrosoi CBS 271.37]|uniref:Unplaced genomic scaffold supercont1.8, whole genome shotgun sequence n=1 Tax=Fonsecaea pedrosoi CBS 271.37 TaxID=1442368 RepID=A0A0D2DBT4_9EURO|nr:uncharacterized protein Z517_11812 [Fonsecaea pedrosoi CBS 271.37]KIW75041.1 hypothetical protein Z517_11812 [Fonsecaea pedrosoi CBS 271.37]
MAESCVLCFFGGRDNGENGIVEDNVRHLLAGQGEDEAPVREFGQDQKDHFVREVSHAGDEEGRFIRGRAAV